MVENQNIGAAAFATKRPELFATGYFTSLMQAGKRPSFGYPANHLPEVPHNATMDFVIDFVALDAR